jgi:predicted RNA-binding Zn-ribbon protein involved in translation (DUF1610 family)
MLVRSKVETRDGEHMALKRSSKGFGKAIARPMASAVRNVEVMGKQQLQAGRSYEGWLCKGKGCGLVMAIVPPPSSSQAPAAASDDRLVTVKCPHCGNEDLYRWNARSNHEFAPKDSRPTTGV